MTLRFSFLSVIITLLAATALFGQADTLVAQFTSSAAESKVWSISGDGRFVVFESRGDVATENPRNADGNVEIFLWDYAQRRIFQITNTKSVLFDTSKSATFDNIRVEITNRRPVISNDGRWIVFESNATSATPTTPEDTTNPGEFDGNLLTATPTPTPTPTATPTATPTPGPNPLTNDANTEIWFYEIPAYSPADLRTGDEIPFTNLAGGNFIRVTNTLPSRLPQPGSATTFPFIAFDNHDATIDDDGDTIAFVSTRDLVTGENPSGQDNDEIFVYLRPTATTTQVTKTPRGTVLNPIYSKNPTISGDGTKLVFASTGDGPIPGMTPGDNPESSRNEEVFFAELANGVPTSGTQITKTTPATPGAIVNVWDAGRRMDRGGRYIAFDSYADLAGTGPNQTAFATFIYDTAARSFRQIGPRSDADSAAAGGDFPRFPTFTDYDASGTATNLVFETRLNIKSDGTVASTASDGLNNIDGRPTQFYLYPLAPSPSAVFVRLTKFPAPSGSFFPSSQPIPSNSSSRITFSLGLVELGTGNEDFSVEGYYLLKPDVTGTADTAFTFFTGASRILVSPSPVPTPTPGTTPTPSPTPTPVTPPAVHGLSPGSLAIMTYDTPIAQPVTPRTAVGSLQRSFPLPIELSGVTMSINGVASGLKQVDQNGIVFVVPQFLSSTTSGTSYPVVINVNGTVIKGSITIVPARPDIFTNLPTPGPGGRALATNVTNRVPTTEPFVVHTVRLRGGQLVSTVLRLRLTGVANTTASVISIRIGSVTISGGRILTGGVPVEPGVYTVDFTLPPELNMAGDQPVIVTVTVNGVTFSSRLDDTAPRLSFL